MGVDEVKVEKTTNSIINRREQHLSKEALLERHAHYLTRRFMKMGEDMQQEKLTKQAEQSRIHYERSMQRAKDSYEAQTLLEQMVRDQRSQIFELMQVKEQERQEKEKSAREERAEREKWVQARALSERIDLERRQKGKEDKTKEIQEKLQEKSHRHVEAAHAVEQEKKDQLRIRLEKEEKKATEAEKRRRERAAQARAEAAARNNDKAEQAVQRRQQLTEEVVKSAREASQRREQKVRENREKHLQELEERQRRFIEKATGERPRLDDSEEGDAAGQQQPDRSSQPDVVRQGSGGGEEQEEAPKPKEVKAAPRPSIYYYCTPRVGKELVEANLRVQREYVRKCTDLEKDKYDMMTHKKFKSLADAAKTMGDKFEGGYTRKMRSLHKMYIDPKPRENAAASPQSSPRGDATGSTAAAQPSHRQPGTQRYQRCGLCERELPLASLEGKALRGNVEKFRQQMPNVAGSGRWATARSGLSASNNTMERASSLSESKNTDVSRAERPGDTLYDYEVRLCTSCWHLMRVAIT